MNRYSAAVYEYDDRTEMAFVFLFFTKFAVASEDDLPLSNTREMAQRCKETSFRELSLDADRVYNWTHTLFRRGNAFVVEGHWRVDGEDVYLECKSLKGAKRMFTTFTVMDEEEL